MVWHGAQGAMDASNLLKPMLGRGELRCIGATTLDEYRKHIEKDPALERRFQQVYVDQPSVVATIAILRGLRERCAVTDTVCRDHGQNTRHCSQMQVIRKGRCQTSPRPCGVQEIALPSANIICGTKEGTSFLAFPCQPFCVSDQRGTVVQV